jgi:hypothetical protein
MLNGCVISQSTVVTLRTTSFNIKKLHTLPMCTILTTNSHYSPKHNNWLVFVMEMQHIHCEVRINFLNIILVNFVLQGLNSVQHVQYREGGTSHQ